ncbi:hypothetical protein ACF1AJ_19245 [Leifsonia sp. NPDC014704]|uniref:hypothetical protein n=1 Tax=Leifsonia sp. NPDC014704 TaxID=3364123 RepID=UPI0036F4B025
MLRELHQEAHTDVAALQAALRMAEEDLLAPWEARSREAAARNRHTAAAAVFAQRQGDLAPLRAQLVTDAARIRRADQRLSASVLLRWLRQRTADRLRADVASRSALALPARNSVTPEWDRWLTDSTDGALAAARAAERAAADQMRAAEAARHEAESWWEENVQDNVEPSALVREESDAMDYAFVDDDSFDRRAVYERQLERAEARENSIAADLVSAAARIGLVSSIAPGAVSAVVGAVDGLFDLDHAAEVVAAVGTSAAPPAIFGGTGDRTLEQVMGTPLGGLDARVNALVEPPSAAAIESQPNLPRTTLGA